LTAASQAARAAAELLEVDVRLSRDMRGHPLVEYVAVDRVAAARDVSSTAVIWLSVSVPVLSELMADVEPSVSVDAATS
jgi:hypothetical protein